MAAKSSFPLFLPGGPSLSNLVRLGCVCKIFAFPWSIDRVSDTIYNMQRAYEVTLYYRTFVTVDQIKICNADFFGGPLIMNVPILRALSKRETISSSRLRTYGCG